MAKLDNTSVTMSFPQIDDWKNVSWSFVTISKEEALDHLKELAAELGYNLIKCVED